MVHLLHLLLHLGLLLLLLSVEPTECLVTHERCDLTGHNQRRDTLYGGRDAFTGCGVDGDMMDGRCDTQRLQFLEKLATVAATVAVEEHDGLGHIGVVYVEEMVKRMGGIYVEPGKCGAEWMVRCRVVVLLIRKEA